MKISKLSHVLSVLFGLGGAVLWIVAVFASPAFGQTQEVMLMCAALSFLAAIFLVLAAMHHIVLEKTKEIV